MTNNKSIDGLSTHDAKTSASAKKAPKKTKKPKKVIAVEEIKEEIIEENSVLDDLKTADTSEFPIQTVEDFLSPVQAFDFDAESGELKKSKKPAKTMKNSEQVLEVKEKPTKKSKKFEKKSGAPKKTSKTRKVLSVVALVIVFALIGIVLWGVFWGNDIIAKITGGQGNLIDLLTFTDENYEPLRTDANGRTNILAFGTSGYNMEGDEGNGIHAGAQLTDSIMLISLNQETGDIAMLSLPRDLKASPTCTATGKINEVYWCNDMSGDDEEAGATALMAEVGSILGVDIQYYAHLNWGSLVSIVDTLGGIEVTLDEDISDYYWTGANYDAGVTYTLNGEQALGLARARHGTIGGDFSRGASQQKILIGIKNKLYEKDLTVAEIVSLAATLGDNLRTNFSVSNLKTLAHLTFDFDFDNMRELSLWPDFMATGSINGISYVLPRAGVGNYGAIQNYVATMLSNDPRVYEDASILVLNATGEDGLASDERLALTDAGYTISDIGNAEFGTYTDKYNLYLLNIKASGTADLLEDYYHTWAKSVDDLPDGISRDYDIVLILGPSPADKDENEE